MVRNFVVYRFNREFNCLEYAREDTWTLHLDIANRYTEAEGDTAAGSWGAVLMTVEQARKEIKNRLKIS